MKIRFNPKGTTCLEKLCARDHKDFSDMTFYSSQITSLSKSIMKRHKENEDTMKEASKINDLAYEVKHWLERKHYGTSIYADRRLEEERITKYSLSNNKQVYRHSRAKDTLYVHVAQGLKPKLNVYCPFLVKMEIKNVEELRDALSEWLVDAKKQNLTD